MGQRFDCPHCGQQIKAIADKSRHIETRSPGKFQQVTRSGRDATLPGRSVWSLVKSLWGDNPYSKAKADMSKYITLHYTLGTRTVMRPIPITLPQLRDIIRMIDNGRTWSRANLEQYAHVSQPRYPDLCNVLSDLQLLVPDDRGGQKAKRLTDAGYEILLRHAGVRHSAF